MHNSGGERATEAGETPRDARAVAGALRRVVGGGVDATFPAADCERCARKGPTSRKILGAFGHGLRPGGKGGREVGRAVPRRDKDGRGDPPGRGYGIGIEGERRQGRHVVAASIEPLPNFPNLEGRERGRRGNRRGTSGRRPERCWETWVECWSVAGPNFLPPSEGGVQGRGRSAAQLSISPGRELREEKKGLRYGLVHLLDALLLVPLQRRFDPCVSALVRESFARGQLRPKLTKHCFQLLLLLGLLGLGRSLAR